MCVIPHSIPVRNVAMAVWRSSRSRFQVPCPITETSRFVELKRRRSIYLPVISKTPAHCSMCLVLCERLIRIAIKPALSTSAEDHEPYHLDHHQHKKNFGDYNTKYRAAVNRSRNSRGLACQSSSRTAQIRCRAQISLEPAPETVETDDEHQCAARRGLREPLLFSLACDVAMSSRSGACRHYVASRSSRLEISA